MLINEVNRDLFPDAKVLPMRADAPPNEKQTMTVLPIELDPGPPPSPETPVLTPLRYGLGLAWLAALIALSAVGLGGWSLLALAERRIRFVSAVTHELRTPLTTQRLYLDMLTSGMVQDEQQKTEYLQTLHNETERLNRLVGIVLDFSRLEKQRPKLDLTRVIPAELLETVRANWEGRCASAGKELVLDNQLAESLMLRTDVKLVEQILGNLVDNACKYSQEATDKRIWLRARQDGQRIVLEVEDRGPGVPPSERRTIFRAFRRGTGTGTETTGGVGLGLALAQRWAHLLGGKLSVTAGRDAAGACFQLALPAYS
jgi:signal transduction histidine kinase